MKHTVKFPLLSILFCIQTAPFDCSSLPYSLSLFFSRQLLVRLHLVETQRRKRSVADALLPLYVGCHVRARASDRWASFCIRGDETAPGWLALCGEKPAPILPSQTPALTYLRVGAGKSPGELSRRGPPPRTRPSTPFLPCMIQRRRKPASSRPREKRR